MDLSKFLNVKMLNNQNYKEKLYSSYITYISSNTVENIKSDLNTRKPYIEKLIKDLFPSNKDINILDIGCGHGAFLYFLKEKGYKNLKGLDISSEQVNMAYELGLNNVSHSNLLEDLPKLPENSYDVIIAFDIIEPKHVKSIITELGILTPNELSKKIGGKYI